MSSNLPKMPKEEFLNDAVKKPQVRQGLADWEMSNKKPPMSNRKSVPEEILSHSCWIGLAADHQYALSQAVRLCGVANQYQSWPDGETQLRATTDQFIEFWKIHSLFHMRAEEEILLPFVARYADLNQDPINRMLRDHVLLRRDVAFMHEYLVSHRSYYHSEIMHVLAERLENHILFEEKYVFPLIERSLPVEALIELANRLAAYDDDQNRLLFLTT